MSFAFITVRSATVLTGAFLFCLAVAREHQVPVDAASFPSDEKSIVHLLSRIGFGPRPGDVARVKAIGVQRYIDEQLHPERIKDEAMRSRLAHLTTLGMSTSELAEQYYLPAQMERQRRRQEMLQQSPGSMTPTTPVPPEGNQLTPAQQRERDGVRQILGDLSQQKILRATYSERQLEEVLVDFWFNHFNVFAGKGLDRIFVTSYERDVIRPHVFGKFRDLLGATAESPAMLFYLDNWMSADPNAEDPRMQRATRPNGNRPNPNRQRPRGRPRLETDGKVPMVQPVQPPRPQRNQGLNENYARELMELHTLGVDGGYTQQDVMEVARSFTGWTLDRPRQVNGAFRFESRLHDDREKVVLGHRIKAGGGKQDGEQVLDLLAKHPSTARFIATKLARRFVADEPPKGLVDRAAKRFKETDGDLREVVRTIITSSEFFAQEARRAKVKTPFEFIVSALRATNADVTDATALVRSAQMLGMPLYMSQPPTGYPDRADAWVNTGALLNRMNFAVELVSNRLRGVRLDLGALTANGDPAGVRDALVESILNGEASSATLATLAKGSEIRQLAALTIGAPEFQRR